MRGIVDRLVKLALSLENDFGSLVVAIASLPVKISCYPNTMISLFRDDCLSGNERKYYNWLTERFPQSDYLVYPNIALQVIFESELKEDLKPGWPNHESLDEHVLESDSTVRSDGLRRDHYDPRKRKRFSLTLGKQFYACDSCLQLHDVI